MRMAEQMPLLSLVTVFYSHYYMLYFNHEHPSIQCPSRLIALITYDSYKLCGRRRDGDIHDKPRTDV